MNGESEDIRKMPTQVGPYRVVRPLGRSGMGAVYEVEHVNLGTRFALKTFTLDHGYVKLLRDRFLAEGRILARLRHPNLVRVFDLDIDEATETPYFVMDLVQYKDGESYTLADLEQGGADEEHLSRWFSQLCSALDYIHSAGIVHRDIKLGNILLDSQSGVVLSDFGVSRFCDKELRRELALERTIASDGITTGSLVMGTSGYMAPEVKRGGDATPAADAWSLGIVFFRLLTGVWYEPGTNIWSLLDPFNEAWRDVLHGLLAENPADRPVALEPEARKVAEAIGATMDDGERGVPLKPQSVIWYNPHCLRFFRKTGNRSKRIRTYEYKPQIGLFPYVFILWAYQSPRKRTIRELLQTHANKAHQKWKSRQSLCSGTDTTHVINVNDNSSRCLGVRLA